MTNIIKFLTAGNVDDGKSTLIGRLLYDTNSLYDDQIAEAKKASSNNFEGNIDYSLFLDGLSSERAQKITIDVAYRYFDYDGKKFIIADAPGHKQYTKNMAVAAANSNSVIILIDVTKKITAQTKKHSYIASLFGIKNVIVAINKMDLVNYDQKIFNEIKDHYQEIAKSLNFKQINFVPISAINGINLIKNNGAISWYQDQSILNYLISHNLDNNLSQPRFLVQNIIKHDDQRYYQGLLNGLDLKKGDEVTAYPSQISTKIKTIIHSSKKVDLAKNDNAIAITLDDEIDLERGGLLVKKSDKIYFANSLRAQIIWFSNEEFDVKSTKNLLIKINHNYILGQISQSSQDIIALNDIAKINLKLASKVAFDDFTTNKNSGSFLIIDPLSNETLGSGIINNNLTI